MEATALSVGKAVLDGALGYAKSVLADEIALQLGVEQDVAFITDELEMMLSFLMAADEEQDKQKVVLTWVKQVREVAYNVENSLMDFSVHSDKRLICWWCIPRTLWERRDIAKELKELRTRVEDVSNRNLRYRLIKGSGSKPTTTAEEQASIASSALFAINEARRTTMEQEKPKVDLCQLITKGDKDLRVIAMWGESGNFGKISAIKEIYDSSIVNANFGFRAWVQLMHPFDPKDFIQSLVRQFYENFPENLEATHKRKTVGISVSIKMQSMSQSEMNHVFDTQVNDNSYLIVIDDLSTIMEWDCIKKYFPDNKKGSRIIVGAREYEIASVCTEKPFEVSELKQLSSRQTLYLFHKKVVCASDSLSPSKENSTMPNSEIQEEGEEQPKDGGGDKASDSGAGKKFDRSKTMALVDEVLLGRKTEKSMLIELVGKLEDHRGLKVISVWGMGGIGKTTLVRSVYRSQQLGNWKRAWATALRPFNPELVIRWLGKELLGSSKEIETMELKMLTEKLTAFLQEEKCLIVLDDISSITEWDSVKSCFGKATRIIVTTREKGIAKHCSKEDKNMLNLSGLEEDVALDLFKNKVFKDDFEKNKLLPDMIQQARFILKKCNGLPLAISTIGGFLATKPKTATEWRKTYDRISTELEISPELRTIKTVLVRSYDGLPYHLKSCFLYLSIFPEDHKVRRRLLTRRWTAEGFSSEIHDKTAEEIADSYFMQLIGRSMILPSKTSLGNRKEIDSCHVHDLMREIAILKSTEENLVFRLEEGCSSKTQGKVRHLAVSSNWHGDKSEFESTVDLSHIRSLTVFGDWKQFFISKKMTLLRVLDLEGTRGLLDHNLEHIGSLFHLKYISLRGCDSIYHLPDSWGNLQLLQTLDMKGTCICKLPRTIIKLKKLQYLFAGDHGPACVFFDQRLPDDLTKLCVACCAPKYLKDAESMDGDPNRHDVCSFWCHVVFPTLASRRQDPYGVVVPRGIRNLKDLRTLGAVNISTSGKAILQDIRRLTQLRKLAVGGINPKNCEELYSTLANLSRLESLSAKSSGVLGLLGFLDGVFSAPKNLQSLKLAGTLIKLPELIGELQNLVKLKLESTKLTEVDGTMQVLGMLPKLAILQLRWETFSWVCGEARRLTFYGEAFPSLMVLELFRICGLRSVEFKDGTTPKLELLRFDHYSPNSDFFSGLASLHSLKEFMLDDYAYEEGFLNDVQRQLESNENTPILKRGSWR